MSPHPKPPRPHRRALITVLLTVGSLAGLPLFAQPGASPLLLDPARVGWSSLSYSASKFGFDSRSEIALEQVTAAELTAALITPPQGRGLTPRNDPSLLLRLDNRALGRDAHIDLWLDPKDATAYQRSQLEAGQKRSRYKVYRFTEDGVFSRRLLPEKGEENLPRERWSDVIEEYDRFEPGRAVTEPAALFYVVAAAPLAAPGDRVEVQVFSSHHVYPVEISVEASEQIEVDHVIRSPEGEQRVKGPLETLRLLIHPRQAGDAKTKDFRFVGIEGDVELHLDPKTRAPVQIRGKSRYAGKLRVTLTGVTLAQPAPAGARACGPGSR